MMRCFRTFKIPNYHVVFTVESRNNYFKHQPDEALC